MRIISFLAALAPLCSVVTSAAVAISEGRVANDADSNAPASVAARRLLAPKFKQPPSGYKQKRDGDKFVFGGFKTNDGSCKDAYCQLWEPLDQNGRPHPWCQSFSGSNGYTALQQPSIEIAHIDEVKANKSDFPQWVCYFYNNFDCDPSKDKSSSGTSWSSLTDKTSQEVSQPPGFDFDFKKFKGAGDKRLNYFKSYGCMLYDDAPYSDQPAAGGTAELSGYTDMAAVVMASMALGQNAGTAAEAGNSTVGNSTVGRS